jgi:diaminopimelate epimerase
MPTLRFYKAVPGGNPTILILDPVPAAERAGVARELMDAGHLQAEQVGYLDLGAAPVRLDMMGGEFCGNACRAAAAVMAREGVGLRADGGALRGELSVSGAGRPVEVRVERGGVCWAEMPLPPAGAGFGMTEIAPGMGLVPLPGITHLCLDEALHPFPADFATAAAGLRARLGLDAEAVGCIWYRTAPSCAIKPVVWVRSTASTHFETGCGSGSLALALWLGNGQNFPTDLAVLQPSGKPVGVRIDELEGALRAWIHGPVDLVARGEAFL